MGRGVIPVHQCTTSVAYRHAAPLNGTNEVIAIAPGDGGHTRPG